MYTVCVLGSNMISMAEIERVQGGSLEPPLLTHFKISYEIENIWSQWDQIISF